MKNIIKAWFLITFSMLFTTGCSDVKIVPSVQQELPKASVEESENVQLTSDAVYTQLTQEINCYNNTIVMDNSVDKEEISNAVKKLQNRRPDIFWLDGYSITYDSVETELKFKIINGYTSDELQAMYSKLESKVTEIISMMPENSTEYEKILFVHDYIVNNTEYDDYGAECKENGMWGNAYGCLIMGKAVCQGYSEAFTYIMNRLGIESGICTGDSVTGRHAWNYVKLDGNYYWIDVTWDDPESEVSFDGQLRHSNFMMNDEMLMRTRTPDLNQFFVPKCNSLEYNYFVNNGGYFTSYNIEDIAKYMSANKENHEVEIMFSSEVLYETAINLLFSEEEIWKVADYVWLEDEIYYSQDDSMYVVKINF